LDDGAGCAVTGGIEIGKPDVMGSPIDAIDHGIGSAFEFIIEPARDQPADDGRIQTFAGEHIACRAALYAALGQRPVHALDDVAALTELAQHRLRLVVDRPLAATDLPGQPEGFELAQPPELNRTILIGRLAGARRDIDPGAACVACQLAVETGPAFRRYLALERSANVVIGARPELLGDEIARPVAHPFLDVV